MTKDELKALIAEKIEGQGNQIDLGGALAEILTELVDNAGGGSGIGFVKIPNDLSEIAGDSPHTKAEYASLLGITEEDVDKIFTLDYAGAMVTDGGVTTGIFSIDIKTPDEPELAIVTNSGTYILAKTGEDEYYLVKEIGN